MKLVSMETAPEERWDDLASLLLGADGSERYPEGTRLCLEGAPVARLGLDRPAVGTLFKLEGYARVVGYREDADDDADRTEDCVELQITELGLEPDDDAARERRDDARTNELGGRTK